MEALQKRVYQQAALPPAQRQYLTREELEAQHGADPADIEAIEQVAQEHDLRAAYRNDAEWSIVLEGELGNLLDAFPADVRMYHHALGTYRGRQGEIHISQQLNGIITGIELFTEAAALGVAICVAAGDDSTADLDASSWDDKTAPATSISSITSPSAESGVLGAFFA